MDSALTVLMGFSGCGILAFFSYMITGLIGKKSKVLSTEHNIKQDKIQKDIKEIETKQSNIIDQIQKNEKIKKKSIKKIKKIQKQATKDIQEILKEDKISVINNTIDSEWNSISKELG